MATPGSRMDLDLSIQKPTTLTERRRGVGEKEGAKKDSETMSLEEDFKAAANFVRSLPSDGPVKPDNDTKLKFYSFYKQATEGDVKGDRPGMFSFEAKAKWSVYPFSFVLCLLLVFLFSFFLACLWLFFNVGHWTLWEGTCAFFFLCAVEFPPRSLFLPGVAVSCGCYFGVSWPHCTLSPFHPCETSVGLCRVLGSQSQSVQCVIVSSM